MRRQTERPPAHHRQGPSNADPLAADQLKGNTGYPVQQRSELGVGEIVSSRVYELKRIEAALVGEPGGPWLARAFRERLEARLAAEEAATENQADRIARLLLSDVCGTALVTRLWADFPAATRAMVYFAVALAKSDMEGERLGLLADVSALRDENRALKEKIVQQQPECATWGP